MAKTGESARTVLLSHSPLVSPPFPSSKTLDDALRKANRLPFVGLVGLMNLESGGETFFGLGRMADITASREFLLRWPDC